MQALNVSDVIIRVNMYKEEGRNSAAIARDSMWKVPPLMNMYTRLINGHSVSTSNGYAIPVGGFKYLSYD